MTDIPNSPGRPIAPSAPSSAVAVPPRFAGRALAAAVLACALVAGCAERQDPEPVVSRPPQAPLANGAALPGEGSAAARDAAGAAGADGASVATGNGPPAEGEDDALAAGNEGRGNLLDQDESAGAPAAATPPAPAPSAKVREAARADARAAIGAMALHREAHELAQPAPALPADLYAIGIVPRNPASTERYQHLDDNPIHLVAENPVSTFSLDVDTGSYSNVRRFLAGGHRPPEDAVRVEELVNYFPYDYPAAEGEHPFGIRTELAPCPWNPGHWLMRVAVRADEVDAKTMPPANLVFLVDVSGSMDDPAKLPLLRSSLKLLASQLRAEDRVSLVVYAGREAVVLEPTPGDQRSRIEGAIDNLAAGGSTAGEAGIRLAYRMARQARIPGGINRVLLATDGDFNVGVTDFEQLKDLVERERESGVQLSTLGFGTGNYNEQLMEQLADSGNGSYAYIDTLAEGRKVLVDQVRSTLVTVAKDVKVQVEFNPLAVSEYRLIGYENRVLAREDFANDRIDAGDVGAGQSVTALYELTPAGAKPSVDPLRYGAPPAPPADDHLMDRIEGKPYDEIAFVKVRYKKPDASVSRLVEMPVGKASLVASFEQAGDDFRFAAAVAGFGQLLRGGKRTGAWTLDDVLATATASRGRDEFGYRSEFLSLVRMAKVSG